MSSNPLQEQPQPLLTSSTSPSSTTAFVAHGDALDDFLVSFWKRQVATAESDPPHYGKHPPLPLARIKKVMKADPDVRMIASDAPVLFCKACEIFIQELTCRAFLVADAHKRRTISKSDIARALSKSDHFDFLIDIVPRDETERNKAARVAASIPAGTHARKSSTSGSSGRVNPSGRTGSGSSATANGSGGPDSMPSAGPMNHMGLPSAVGGPSAMHRRASLNTTQPQLSTSPTSMGPPPQFLGRTYTQPHINDGVHRHGNLSMTSHRPSHPQLSMQYAHAHIPPTHQHQHQQTPTPTSASSDHQQHFPQTPQHFPPHYSHSHSYPPPHGPITSPTTHTHAHPYGRPRHSNSDPPPMMRYGTAPPPPGPAPFGYAMSEGAYGDRKPSISPTTGAVEGLEGDATMQDAGR